MAEVMPGSTKLGRLFGIPIALHYSWFIIASLITLSLASRFARLNPSWSPGVLWGAAVGTAFLFFGSIILHELSHALVARKIRLPVRSITLFALGGVAQIDSESSTAKGEFWMAIVGPLTSVAIGAGCLSVAQALGWSLEAHGLGVGASILGWLGYVNVGLAVFNMVPGYPLDGGRVLRAILWGFLGNVDRATRQAARTGQIVAGLFIMFGLLGFFTGANIGALWLAFIGWFLLEAAQGSYAQVAITESLRNVSVREFMDQSCGRVQPAQDLRTFVDDVLLRSGRRCFIVNRDGQSVGLITPREVKKIDGGAWSRTTVGDAMRPIQEFRRVTPNTSASEALSIMTREDLDQLPVTSNGDLIGVVTRGQILQLVQTRLELGRQLPGRDDF